LLVNESKIRLEHKRDCNTGEVEAIRIG
jgi:hypothetical protein